MDLEVCGEHIILTREEVAQSVLLASLDGMPDGVALPQTHVSRSSMCIIKKFLAYHCAVPYLPVPKPITTSVLADLVGAWDADLVDLSAQQLADVLMAANYLNIPTLLNLTLGKMASLLFRKTPAEMNCVLGVRDLDATKILGKHPWIINNYLL